MFTNILVAIDGSDEALHASSAAGRLAAVTGGRIRLITAYGAPGDVLGEPGYSARLDVAITEADRHLRACEAAVTEAGAPAPEVDRVAGDAGEVILRAAESGGHDLIVIGNRGRGRVAGALLGSVSSTVASHAAVPVLIVPRRAA
jgi:nucleotide-binding universal stress UspA family protein